MFYPTGSRVRVSICEFRRNDIARGPFIILQQANNAVRAGPRRSEPEGEGLYRRSYQPAGHTVLCPRCRRRGGESRRVGVWRERGNDEIIDCERGKNHRVSDVPPLSLSF